MAETEREPSYWAILIGINFYPNERHLQGCVHDVQDIQQFLASGSEHWHTRSFTASTPSDTNSRQPSETSNSWPTFQNITSCLLETRSQAKKGDFVYIHYAGHGISEQRENNTSSLALVLFDEIQGSRYLRGAELAYYLKSMVEYGLHVTLVLDCCFSGDVLRHTEGIRSIDYNPSIDEAYPLDPDIDSNHQVLFQPIRDAHLFPDWIVNPSGYTILSACGPHETAKELKVGEKRHGALSFFLIRALSSLRKRQAVVTH